MKKLRHYDEELTKKEANTPKSGFAKNKKVLLTLTPELAEKFANFAREHGYSGICDLVRRVVAEHLRERGVSVSEEEIKVVQGKRNDLDARKNTTKE
ncbi:MAG: hypothetical protein IJY80_02860 [Opitutales bacterium]|nr:hypothetical protein [Opitutales bacterium]